MKVDLFTRLTKCIKVWQVAVPKNFNGNTTKWNIGAITILSSFFIFDASLYLFFPRRQFHGCSSAPHLCERKLYFLIELCSGYITHMSVWCLIFFGISVVISSMICMRIVLLYVSVLFCFFSCRRQMEFSAWGCTYMFLYFLPFCPWDWIQSSRKAAGGCWVDFLSTCLGLCDPLPQGHRETIELRYWES